MRLARRSLMLGAVGATLAPLARPARADTTNSPSETGAVLYVSHGAPLFAVNDPNRLAELRAWGTRLGRPRGIVVVTPHFASRHWLLGATGPGVAMRNLPAPIAARIPAHLGYPTPPSDALATRVTALLSPSNPGAVARAAPRDRPGFDHTTWMPLACLYPAADVPVLELAYPYLGDRDLLSLGRTLAPLRDEGIAFVASGGLTHNLASATVDGTPTPVPAWSIEFDAWATDAMKRQDVDALVDWRARAPAQALAHPDDGAHYRTLLLAMGVVLGARATARAPSFPVVGFESSLSKRCIELG